MAVVDVLVTGAGGVLGREIVNLLRPQYHVVACGRVPGENIDAVWDIVRHDTLTPDCEPEIVVHGAARIAGYKQSLSNALSLFETNVLGTVQVVRWCALKQVKKLIILSSAIVYGEWQDFPKSEADPVKPWVAGPYAVSKWCGEQAAHLVKECGCKLSILRLSSLFGPKYINGLPQRMISQGLRTGSIEVAPPFETAFDIMYVSDAARAVELAVASEDVGLWNIGSGRLTTVRKLAELCAYHLGVKTVLSEKDIHGKEPLILNWVNDERARRKLGHTNEISLDEGISSIVHENKNGLLKAMLQ